MSIINKEMHYWDKIIKTHRIYADTCSLMDDKADVFFDDLRQSILRVNKQDKKNYKLIIPKKVVDEIQKHISKKDIVGIKAQNAKIILEKFLKDNILEFKGDPGEAHADNVFLTQFTRLRMKNNLCLITQDRSLIIDIYNLNNSRSVNIKKDIQVVKVGKDGSINVLAVDKTNKIKVIKSISLYKSNKSEKIQTSNNKKFKYITDYKCIKSEILKCSKTPTTGDIVKSNKFKNIKLGKKISSGGEGVIYNIPNEMVCKIYKPDKLTNNRLNKLKKMVEVQINKEGICWPIDLVYNENNEFVGYIMKKAYGQILKTSVFIPPRLRHETFPNWKKKDLVELAITILDKIKYLHSLNIIIGDINPLNILVKSSTEVYFVDTDSYQIENYPCPVGTIEFTPPELQGKNYETFLRSFENEYFAVATLVFMILLPGKSPYTQQGGGNPAANIMAMEFPYPCGKNSTGKAPDGVWKYTWSNLPKYVKEDLYGIFSKYGEYSSINKRKTTIDLYNLMRRYKNDLNNKIFDDEQMYEMFANRPKQVSSVVYSRCTECANEFPERELRRNGMCKICSETKGIQIKCNTCGNLFEFTKGQMYDFRIKGYEIPKRCQDCRRASGVQPQRKQYTYQNSTKSYSNSSNSHGCLGCLSVFILAAFFLYIAIITLI